MKNRITLIIIPILLISISCCNSDSITLNPIEKSLEQKIFQIMEKFEEIDQSYFCRFSIYYKYSSCIKKKSEELIKQLQYLNNDKEEISKFKIELENYIKNINSIYTSGIIDNLYQTTLYEILESFTDTQYIRFKKLITDHIILNEFYVINDLWNSFIKDKYQFNHLEPVILENKNELKIGEIYQAEIMIAAFDTTLLPEIFIKVKTKTNKTELHRIPIKRGRGIYTAKTKSIGEKKFEGFIRYIDFNNDTLILNFENRYNVK
ncbi:MAG: hypothetical protein KAT68_00355 [Bacteroidales bacterium]|nr:hypothetical protein [Bacteroidales bacterium]